MISYIDFEPGIFYALDKGYAVAKDGVAAGPFSFGQEFQLNTMFQMRELTRDGNKVGFYLFSPFKTVNKGGVLYTFLESKKGKAVESRVVIRTPELVIYDLVNVGSMAITTHMNDMVKSILAEQ